MLQKQFTLWEEEKPTVENFIECVHYDGSREIISTYDKKFTSEEWLKDKTCCEAGFVRREAYEEYKRKKEVANARI